MTMKLGKPKYEQSSKNYFAFKKDQNTFILRVLPPMGNLADAGKWSFYHRVEFGHVGTDGRMKPFLSPRVVNYEGMVEVESECHVRRENIKAQLEQAKAAGNAALQEQCNTMLRKYNQDAKHYMNVVDLQGNVGLFKIGHRGFQALKGEIERLRSEGVDPVGIENGRYFVFSRSGKNRDTVYTVTEYKQKQEMDTPQGKVLVDVPFPHSINEAIMAKLGTDAFELDSVYPAVTAEEEYRIVHEGASAVDAILGKDAQKAKNAASQPAQEQSAPANPASTQAAPAQAQAAPAAQTQAPVGGNLAQPSAPAAEPAPQAAPQTTTVESQAGSTTVDTGTGEVLSETPAASAPAQAQSVAEMSEEDFFKKVESGNL